jgi:hypothetical protein
MPAASQTGFDYNNITSGCCRKSIRCIIPVSRLISYLIKDVFADILRDGVPLLTELSLSIVPCSPTSTLQLWSSQMVMALPRLRNMELAFTSEGHRSRDDSEHPIIPQQYAEYEMISMVGVPSRIITHREGSLWRKSKSPGHIPPDVKLHRRYFDQHGWVWYSDLAASTASLEKPLASHAPIMWRPRPWTIPLVVAFLAISIMLPFMRSFHVFAHT